MSSDSVSSMCLNPDSTPTISHMTVSLALTFVSTCREGEVERRFEHESRCSRRPRDNRQGWTPEADREGVHALYDTHAAVMNTIQT